MKGIDSMLGSLGMGEMFRASPPPQANSGLALPQAVDAPGLLAAQAAQAAQAMQDMQNRMNHALAGNSNQHDASRYMNPQQGWASTQLDPIDELVKNPFQAASLYFRLRMTKAELKAKDIEIAFVRRMGGSVHCVIINQERVLTMIDEDVGAFPSDAFIARIRLLL